ncbi:GGDEF domain-containing protein [Pseudomonas vancouverensis]|uniref:GGDEF domain-containing protein n=1 Tax=Pseudomonas vancouverensis TaxID=95300 RepID=UPI003D01898E
MLMPGKSCRAGHADPLLTPQQARERLRDQLRQAEQELTGVQMASMDELTLLSNRHGFTALAQLGLDACRELEIAATLLYFTLEDFTRINDLYGVAEGDEALKTFADVLRIAFRENDVVGRLKGDCFAVLLTGSSAVEIVAIQARLKEMLEERNAMAHRRFGIRFSAGQIEIDPQDNQSVEDLLAEVERVPGQ